MVMNSNWSRWGNRFKD